MGLSRISNGPWRHLTHLKAISVLKLMHDSMHSLCCSDHKQFLRCGNVRGGRQLFATGALHNHDGGLPKKKKNLTPNCSYTVPNLTNLNLESGHESAATNSTACLGAHKASQQSQQREGANKGRGLGINETLCNSASFSEWTIMGQPWVSSLLHKK